MSPDPRLLAMIANGLIDANKLARVALANRGLDNNGKWIGFNKLTLKGLVYSY